VTEFHLHLDEALPEGIRRLAGQQLTRALDQLETSGDALERRIHEARKSLKRLRALVCLVRAQLGPAQMRWELRSIGLTARLLGGMRDAEALIEGLDRLDAWSGKTHPRVRAWLEARKSSAAGGLAVGQVVDALRWAQVRLEGWPLRGLGWEAIGPGLRWVYGRGRRAMRQAAAEGGEEHFHQWRRYAKYGWYHTQVLEGLWPAMTGILQAELDQVGEALGGDHDLAVLGGLLAQWPARRSRAEVLDLARLIPARQAELQTGALALGGRLYAESPRAFERRWGRYWAGWRGEGPSEI